MNTETIQYLGVKLIIDFTVSGKYYPATYYEPAEYPDYEIHEIKVEDSNINIYDLFVEDQIDEIYNLLNN
jgi:hypothetical protein